MMAMVVAMMMITIRDWTVRPRIRYYPLALFPDGEGEGEIICQFEFLASFDVVYF